MEIVEEEKNIRGKDYHDIFSVEGRAYSDVYTRGRRCTQVYYVLCRKFNLKELGSCKIVVGETVARQYRMMVYTPYRMTLQVKKRKRVRDEPRIRWGEVERGRILWDIRRRGEPGASG